MKRRSCLGAVAVGLLALSTTATAQESVLYRFTGRADGGSPQAPLWLSRGVLYGTTITGGDASGDGTVFALAPPKAGKTRWIETVLHKFGRGRDGLIPAAGLVGDRHGALFGTTKSGGANGAGTVFRLTPPASGQTAWTETVLYSFGAINIAGGFDGVGPVAPLIEDTAGALYGTTEGGGVNPGAFGAGIVFELTPPATAGKPWKETILHRFAGGRDGAKPVAGLVANPAGALFGTTSQGGTGCGRAGCGTVFELTAPGTRGIGRSERVLYRFTGGEDGGTPLGDLVMDARGALYGTTLLGGKCQCGTVFRLNPPAAGSTSWTETVLHQFAGGKDGQGPEAGLTAAAGALFGTTYVGGTGCNSADCGVVFKMTPPAAGRTDWTETVRYSFKGGPDAAGPLAGLTTGARGVLFGTAFSGGIVSPFCGSGCGAVFRLP